MRSDLARALAASSRRFAYQKKLWSRVELDATNALDPAEWVLTAAYGFARGGGWSNHAFVVAVTDQRLLVVRRAGRQGGTESIAWDTLTGVSTGRRGSWHSIKFTAAGANDEVPGLAGDDAERVATYVRQLLSDRPRLATQPGASPATLAKQLRDLQALADDGLLTQQEFLEQKAKLLQRD
jgi:hypothetical protein